MNVQSQIRSDNATESHYQRIRTTPSQALSERLAGRGVRLTTKRKTLLKILEEADQHLDAASLLKAAQQHMEIDRATVYRTLDLLKREGLIDELDLMHLRGEMHYYEARTGKEHFHLACLECGRIEEVSMPIFDELKRQVSKDRGFQIETARLEIGGYCPECAAKIKKGHRMSG
jgi:Fur family ferric uptake transcriptional regulator